jgi:hypothetical protein
MAKLFTKSTSVGISCPVVGRSFIDKEMSDRFLKPMMGKLF